MENRLAGAYRRTADGGEEGEGSRKHQTKFQFQEGWVPKDLLTAVMCSD